MAISGVFEFRGLTIGDCYVRVRRMIFLGKNRVQCQAEIWATQTEAQADGGEMLNVATFEFDYSDLARPIYDAAYASLKAMPEFQGFTDC
jgi:hypothetical protein